MPSFLRERELARISSHPARDLLAALPSLVCLFLSLFRLCSSHLCPVRLFSHGDFAAPEFAPPPLSGTADIVAVSRAPRGAIRGPLGPLSCFYRSLLALRLPFPCSSLSSPPCLCSSTTPVVACRTLSACEGSDTSQGVMMQLHDSSAPAPGCKLHSCGTGGLTPSLRCCLNVYWFVRILYALYTCLV